MFRGLSVGACVLAAVLAHSTANAAVFGSRELIRVPKPTVLGSGAFCLQSTGSLFLPGSAGLPVAGNSGWPGLALSFGMYDRVEIGVSGISAVESFDSFAGNVRFLIAREEPDLPALACGIADISGDGYALMEDLPPVTMARQYEAYRSNWSGYLVAGKELASVGKVVLGIGTGRFVGWGPTNQWAQGFFGGIERSLYGPVSGLAEFDGRNLNAGVMVGAPENRVGDFALDVGGRLACKYIQNVRASSWALGLRPAFSLDIAFSMRPLPRRVARAPVLDPPVSVSSGKPGKSGKAPSEKANGKKKLVKSTRTPRSGSSIQARR